MVFFIYSSHVNAIQLNIVPCKPCNFPSPVLAATEFQMGGTELCRPERNQQFGFFGQQRQNVQGQPYF